MEGFHAKSTLAISGGKMGEIFNHKTEYPQEA
jgi:hypothetical protein